MSNLVTIPVFPLSILPLPGEMVPLHIFEPRYRQLLQDAEAGVPFGIYFNNLRNENKFGSMVKLETVIKRYSTGESDIIVKCYDLFTLHSLSKVYSDKLYPGGEVSLLNVDALPQVGPKLMNRFAEFLLVSNSQSRIDKFTIFNIATYMNLDLDGKIKFLNMDEEKRESFLFNQLDYQTQLWEKTEKARDSFHLN
jgi:uncharacterized protein